MKRLAFTLLLLLVLFPNASSGQAPSVPAFQDELLDHLQGHWLATDKIGSISSVFLLQSEWTLNHQFLHISQRQQVVEGTTAFGADFYIGYDPAQQKYVVHVLTTFGAAGSPIGTGERKGNDLTITFSQSRGDIVYHFSWQPESATWRIAAADNGRTFIDLMAKRTVESSAKR